MEEPQQEEKEMRIFDHLVELRKRLMFILAYIGALFIVFFYFSQTLYEWASLPIRKFLPENTSMIATHVTAPFFTPLKLAFFLSFVVAMPMILYQIWRFVAPGLYQKERRLAMPLLIMSIVLFYLGMSFAYFVVFPIIAQFFFGFLLEGVVAAPDISYYLNFFLKIMFAFGMAFEIPVVTIILCAMDVVSPESLAKKRAYIFVSCFIFGMLLTPPDPFSQTFLAVPMWLLFEFGLLSSKILFKNKEKNQSTS